MDGEVDVGVDDRKQVERPGQDAIDLLLASDGLADPLEERRLVVTVSIQPSVGMPTNAVSN